MKEKKKKRFHTREFGGVPKSIFWLIASGKTLWFFTSLASTEILSALRGIQRKVNHGSSLVQAVAIMLKHQITPAVFESFCTREGTADAQPY